MSVREVDGVIDLIGRSGEMVVEMDCAGSFGVVGDVMEDEGQLSEGYLVAQSEKQGKEQENSFSTVSVCLIHSWQHLP